MLKNLDMKDRKMLYQLDINARQPLSEIAKKIKLNKDTAGYRIKKLEEKGVIRGYRTVIDSSRLGFILYRTFFNLIDMQPEELEELIDYLKKAKNVWWIAKLDGAWNFLFAVWVKSNKEFQEFYNKLMLKFRKHVKEKLICPLISYKNFSRNYLLKNKQESRLTAVGGGEKQNFDIKDLKILEILAENARTPLVKISGVIKLDPMAVFHRIKKLEKKGIIQGYKTDLDFNILKRDFYSVKINLRETQRIKEIKRYVETIPELVATIDAVGSYDIEFDLEVENSEQYFQIIKELENRFNSIREIIYYRVLKNYKILYMPRIG